jgi:hypothetical protein
MSNPAPPLDIRPGWVQYLCKFSWFNVHGGYELWRHNVEVTKALAALQPLYGKDNVEIVTVDGQRVRGVVRSMKTTQALTTPSVKIQCANGEIVKIPFPSISEIKDHNGKGQ